MTGKSVNNSRALLLVIFCAVLGSSIVAWGVDLRLLADRLWTSKTEKEAQEVYKEIEALSVETYLPLLLNVYNSPLYQDNEATPYLAGVVLQYYMKKENGANVATKLFDVIRSEGSPRNLKRDLLWGITTWYKGPLENAVKECNALEYEANKDMWLFGQYAVAILIQDNYRANSENRQQIGGIAESCLSNSITQLVVMFSEAQKGNWPIKTLAVYRKVLGSRFDKKLIDTLRSDKGLRSRHLLLLARTCGWGQRSQDVLDYLKEMKNELDREGAQSNKQERDDIEKLIMLHEAPTK